MANTKKTTTKAAEEAVKEATPVAETKTEAAKPATKPAAKTATKATKPAAKTAAKSASKTKSTAKTAKPAATKAADEKPKRKYTKKAKEEAPALPGIVDLANMLREKVAGKDVSEVKENIAIEVKVYGDYEAYLYILIKEGTITVEPYGYMEKDVHIDMPITDVLEVIKGNYNFAEKALSGDFYAIGALTKLLKVKKALF